VPFGGLEPAKVKKKKSKNNEVCGNFSVSVFSLFFQVENLQKSLKHVGSHDSSLTIQNKLQQVRELEEEVRKHFQTLFFTAYS
jgi:hypothetical protein